MTLDSAVERVLIPREAGSLAAGCAIRIHQGGVTVVLTQELLAAASAEGKGNLVLHLNAIAGNGAKKLLAALKMQGNFTSLKAVGSPVEAKLFVQGTDGAEHAAAAAGMKLSFRATTAVKGISANVYRLDGPSGGSYVRGIWNEADGSWTVPADGASAYMLAYASRSFADLPDGHWSGAAVQFLSARQLINGVSERNFAPTRAVTRAEFAAMLARALDLKPQPQQSSTPADVSRTAWYADDVSAAYEAGIIAGRDSGQFAPEAAISREEMAVMLMRAYEYGVKAGLFAAIPAEPNAAVFTDRSAISGWAAEAVERAAGLGLLNGRDNGTFAPADSLTRAESVQVLYRLLKP